MAVVSFSLIISVVVSVAGGVSVGKLEPEVDRRASEKPHSHSRTSPVSPLQSWGSGGGGKKKNTH